MCTFTQTQGSTTLCLLLVACQLVHCIDNDIPPKELAELSRPLLTQSKSYGTTSNSSNYVPSSSNSGSFGSLSSDLLQPIMQFLDVSDIHKFILTAKYMYKAYNSPQQRTWMWVRIRIITISIFPKKCYYLKNSNICWIIQI